MSGWRQWSIGELVEFDDFQSFLQDQVVQVYPDDTARTTALGTSVAEGMVAYVLDVGEVQVYKEIGGWVNVANIGDITGVTAGTGLTGGGDSGDVTLNVNIPAVGSAITITASQISDVTSTAAELNILDGVTSTAAELNILDGATLTTAELNHLDGVTSAVQTQINGKVSKTNGEVTTATTSDGVVRNIYVNTSGPTGGIDGDVWLVFTP